MMQTIPEIWQTGDTELLARTMADDAVFSSPVADYRGAEAVHIVGLVAQTIGQIEITHHWDDGDGNIVTAFTARLDDDPMDGVVRERRDSDGVATRVVLFLRPLETLEKAITRIRALRKQYPVGSGITGGGPSNTE